MRAWHFTEMPYPHYPQLEQPELFLRRLGAFLG